MTIIELTRLGGKVASPVCEFFLLDRVVKVESTMQRDIEEQFYLILAHVDAGYC